MHLWMIFKNFTSRRFNFNWHRARCQFGSWERLRPTGVNAVSIFWYRRPFQAPIAALSLKYINHSAIILFYAPLYTEGDDFPRFLHYNTDLCPSTTPARRLAKDEGIGGLPANVCLFGCFFYLSSLPCPPVFHLFNNIDFRPGANNNDNDSFPACHL